LGFISVKQNTTDDYKLHWSGKLHLTLEAFRDIRIASGSDSARGLAYIDVIQTTYSNGRYLEARQKIY